VQHAISSWKDRPDPLTNYQHDLYAQSADAACLAQWSSQPDVMLRDNQADSGAIPASPPWWNSPDIWVRNNPDAVEEHQDPLAGQENTVYVRVSNRGNMTAQDVEVHAYYGTTGLGLTWPADWTEIVSTTLTTLEPQAAELVALPWTPPASGPASLLVRLNSPDDPLTIEGSIPGDNNIAHKNVAIIQLSAEPDVLSAGELDSVDSLFALHNPQEQAVSVDLAIELDALAPDGTVSLHLGTALFERWQTAGAQLLGAEVVPGSASINVTSPVSATVIGLPLESTETLPLTATVTAPPTDVNWLYLEFWAHSADEVFGGLVLRAARNYDLTPSAKTAAVSEVLPGNLVTYTLTLSNTGNLDHHAVVVTDTLPLSLTYVAGSLAWSAGQGDFAAGTLSWTGPVSLTQPTTITYQAAVDLHASPGGIITNTAWLEDGLNHPLQRSAAVEALPIPVLKLYHPLVYKGR
jgi:uncharacterized repeat protein (TIGR01451 family)